MYCVNCGKKLDDDALFCDECGLPVELSESGENEQLMQNDDELPADKEIVPDGEAHQTKVLLTKESFEISEEPETDMGEDISELAAENVSTKLVGAVVPAVPVKTKAVMSHAKHWRGVCVALAFFVLGLAVGVLIGQTVSYDHPSQSQETVRYLRITRQPETTMAKKGEEITFEVAAEGDGLTYQWQLSDDQGDNWRDSSNQTSVYTTTLSDKNNGRSVRCIVTDQYGNSVESNAVYMKITSLKITKQPSDVKGKEGDKISIAVEAVGPGISYQWQLSDDEGENWRDSSTVTAMYATTLSDKNNGRYVRCVVSDRYGNRIVSKEVSMKIK